MQSIDINDYQPLIHKITNKFNQEFKGDLFNECFLQMHELLKRYDDSVGSFQTFCYQRLYYTCVDYINKNNLNHQSLDEPIKNEDNETVTLVDLLESKDNFESDFINKDYLDIKRQNTPLSDIEKFIQRKFYNDFLSVDDIITIYYDYHLIKRKQTFYAILKK